MESQVSSRNIPLPIQREVRQRCGFGCVVCGLPLYEYDHLIGWAKTKEHIASEITLLCDQHHREKTSGLLPLKVVTEANDQPFNFREGVSAPYDLHYSGDECEIILGSVSFRAPDKGYGSIVVPVSIDGSPVLGFVMADQHLLFNLVWYDEYNQIVLHIKNNQLLYSLSPWDIELIGRRLTIREASKKFLLQITFDTPNRVLVERARLLRNGIEVLIDSDGVSVNEEEGVSGVSNLTITAPIGLALGPHPPSNPAAFARPRVSRYRRDFSLRRSWINRNFPINEAEHDGS